jgi:pilus assembly protein Flp/PilA
MEKGITYWRDDSAATAVEYALMASLIALAIVLAVTAIGLTVDDIYTNAILKKALGG